MPASAATGAGAWKSLVLAFILVAGGPLMADPAAPLSLEYRFHRGQELTYQITVRGQVEVDLPGGRQANPIQIDMVVVQKTLEAGPTLATLSMTVETARVLNGTESAPLPEEGQKAMLTIDRRGRIQSMVGAGSWQGSEFAQMQFPAEPLRIGTSWVQEAVTQSQPPVTSRTRYTFTGFASAAGRPCATFDAELLLADGGPSPGSPDGRSKGRTCFDPQLGQVVLTEADSRFSFLLPVPDQPGMTVRSTTTLHTVMALTSAH